MSVDSILVSTPAHVGQVYQLEDTIYRLVTNQMVSLSKLIFLKVNVSSVNLVGRSHLGT